MFIDDLSFIQKPEVLGLPDLDKTLERVRTCFQAAGWEGDGEIGVLWLPPFVLVEIEDNYGVLVWHVKQQNDGISWLISPVPLLLEPLLKQNQTDRLLPIGLVTEETEAFVKQIDTELQLLHDQLSFLRGMPESDQRRSLEADLIVLRQGQLVMQYQDYLADCYLRFLNQVIQEGSTEIRLRTGAVRLQLSPPTSIQPSDDQDAAFLTRIQITQEIWDGYRMAAFKDKVDMLFKSIRFQPDDTQKALILRHVQLRNCIQHHAGKLTAKALSDLGVAKVEITTADKPIVLKAWDRIVLTEEEIILFQGAIKHVAQTFENFVSTTIKARAFRHPFS
jgi:hypothetical protein